MTCAEIVHCNAGAQISQLMHDQTDASARSRRLDDGFRLDRNRPRQCDGTTDQRHKQSSADLAEGAGTLRSPSVIRRNKTWGS
jgi:hypothetical protein